MPREPQSLVFSGYDEVADAYLDSFGTSLVRRRWFQRLAATLPVTGAHVLDLGCGAGIPVARDLAASGHNVVGVDGSAQQILRARRNVPQARFIQGDMCEMAFGPACFDAVVAFYAMTHVPPSRQGGLIASIASWLKPGGTLVASFGAGGASEWTGPWLGTTMFFGHADEGATRRSLAEGGLLLRHAAVEKQDDEEATFLWVHATKE